MTASFEKRLVAIEVKRKSRLPKTVSVIFDEYTADVEAWPTRFTLTRQPGETHADFEQRAKADAGRLGARLIAMTRQRYKELMARVNEEY
ncbi:MAG TPA: hypothetical protein VIG36_06340 [Methylocystis sp.]|jgi:hypothetical protein